MEKQFLALWVMLLILAGCAPAPNLIPLNNGVSSFKTDRITIDPRVRVFGDLKFDKEANGGLRFRFSKPYKDDIYGVVPFLMEEMVSRLQDAGFLVFVSEVDQPGSVHLKIDTAYIKNIPLRLRGHTSAVIVRGFLDGNPNPVFEIHYGHDAGWARKRETAVKFTAEKVSEKLISILK